MTTYRLFPTTTPGGATVSYGGNFISGVVFAVATGGLWFDGYWWWCYATGQSTSAVKCALWSATSSGSGVLVPNSVVTSGTLTAGAWNYIPLATPVQLAPGLDPTTSTHGSAYIAAVGFTGNFPDTSGFWGNTGSPGPGVGGITEGPLTAYSGTAANGGTLVAPWSLPQGVFSTASADPSTTMPNSASTVDNFWVDVQIDTVAPAGYTGSYRLWPNKADSNPNTSGDSAVNYTIATEIQLTAPCTLNNVWYYSQSGAASLATECDVWNVSTGLSVATISSPTWLTASGGAASAGNGWVKAAFAGGTTLPAGDYRVSVYNSGGTGGSWSGGDSASNYWGQGGSGGVGASGITQGPLYAPPQPSAASGFAYASGSPGTTPPYAGSAIDAQPPFGQTPGGTVIFPQLYASVGGTTAQNYWVDLEATISGTQVSGGVSALALAAPAGTVLFPGQASGGVSLLTLAAPAGTPTISGAATVQGGVAALTLAAPAGSAGNTGTSRILDRQGVIISPYDDTAGLLGSEGIGNEY